MSSDPYKVFLQEIQQQIEEAIRSAVDKLTKEALPAPQENKYLSCKEAASYLGVSKPTLFKYTEKGLIKCYRLDGTVRYLQTDLDKAFTQRKFSQFKPYKNE